MPEAPGDLLVRLQLPRGGFRLDVDLVLPGLGTTAVFGPSGSGKSTLLRAIAGLEPQATGRVQVGDIAWQDDTRRLPVHRREVGVVFQHDALLDRKSVV